MNTEIKVKWLEALRSGKYKQRRRKLKDNTSNPPTYCCLGVLCEVMEVESKSKGYPDDEILMKAGLDTDDARDLARWNDAYGRTFEELAEYIEKNL